jgi:hypothetical protein
VPLCVCVLQIAVGIVIGAVMYATKSTGAASKSSRRVSPSPVPAQTAAKSAGGSPIYDLATAGPTVASRHSGPSQQPVYHLASAGTPRGLPRLKDPFVDTPTPTKPLAKRPLPDDQASARLQFKLAPPFTVDGDTAPNVDPIRSDPFVETAALD